MHERSDEPETEVRGDVRIARGLKLRCLRLGLAGKADVVEFHRETNEMPGKTCKLEGVEGFWRPVPVEYKHGSPKPGPYDEIQLCAQALCLEEMLQLSIGEGAIFYGRPHRRERVEIDANLRNQTEELARRLHSLTLAGRTPAAQYEKRCENCSLIDLCLPRIAGGKQDIRQYLEKALSSQNEGQA